MAKRWVTKELEIITTSGWEPENAICEARDDWTVYNISCENGVVIYDPEKQHRLDIQAKEQAKKKAREEMKVNFKLQLSGWQDAITTPRFSTIHLVIATALCSLAAQLLFHFLKGSLN